MKEGLGGIHDQRPFRSGTTSIGWGSGTQIAVIEAYSLGGWVRRKKGEFISALFEQQRRLTHPPREQGLTENIRAISTLPPNKNNCARVQVVLIGRKYHQKWYPRRALRGGVQALILTLQLRLMVCDDVLQLVIVACVSADPSSRKTKEQEV